MLALACAAARLANAAATPTAEAPTMNVRRLTSPRLGFASLRASTASSSTRSMCALTAVFLRPGLYGRPSSSVKHREHPDRLMRHDDTYRDRSQTEDRRHRPAHLRPVHRASRALHLRRHLRGGLAALRCARISARRAGGGAT